MTNRFLHVAAWTVTILSLPCAAAYAVLGALYVTEGQGLHPWVAAGMTVGCVWLGWFASGVADDTDSQRR